MAILSVFQDSFGIPRHPRSGLRAVDPEHWLPRDADGWTVPKPIDDSQIIYVISGDGNDETFVITP